jgi:hypothetical protein
MAPNFLEYLCTLNIDTQKIFNWNTSTTDCLTVLLYLEQKTEIALNLKPDRDEWQIKTFFGGVGVTFLLLRTQSVHYCVLNLNENNS